MVLRCVWKLVKGREVNSSCHRTPTPSYADVYTSIVFKKDEEAFKFENGKDGDEKISKRRKKPVV